MIIWGILTEVISDNGKFLPGKVESFVHMSHRKQILIYKRKVLIDSKLVKKVDNLTRSVFIEFLIHLF